MGLKLSTDFNGITYPDAYYKITGYEFTEAREVEGVKQYRADLDVNMYTNNTKEFLLDKVVMQLPREDFTEDGNTLPAMYTWLKTTPQFDGAVDA